jgi:hypothetical protein
VQPKFSSSKQQKERSIMKIDVIVETVAGNHLLLAEVPDRQHGAMVAEALYYHFKDTPAGSLQVHYVWLRDMSDPRTPHLLDAWPEQWKDYDGWQASVKAWKSSPRGISGDESEPDEATARQAIETELAKLPERYHSERKTPALQAWGYKRVLFLGHGWGGTFCLCPFPIFVLFARIT